MLSTFSGPDMTAALDAVRDRLGDDAMIVHVVRRVVDGREQVDVVAAPACEMEPLATRLRHDPRPAAPGPGERPRVVGLVGPTGAGKTTTAAKLALHPEAFGGRSVGFLSLDTYRVAALEQLQTYADIMGAPFEAAYGPDDVAPAMAALRACDVILVDAPGRSPSNDGFVEWRLSLRQTRPDELHLVLPATIRPSVAAAHWAAYAGAGVTHLLVTKLDELPDPADAYDLVRAVELPLRWVADGQDVPGNLRRGGAGVFTAAAEAVERSRARMAG